MKKVELGKTGVFVNEVSLGCMLMGSKINKQDSFTALDRFTEIGGDFLDTANCYAWWIGKGELIGDESEVILGEWMKEQSAGFTAEPSLALFFMSNATDCIMPIEQNTCSACLTLP